MSARIINMFPRSICNPGAESFVEWYAAYPRKAGRADAEKAYIHTMLKGHMAPAMLLGALCYAAMHRKIGTERQFLLLPASFLRGERFLDEELLDYIPATPEQIATSKDRADKFLKRGVYAPKYE